MSLIAVVAAKYACHVASVLIFDNFAQVALALLPRQFGFTGDCQEDDLVAGGRGIADERTALELRVRYERYGYDGVPDRRCGRPSRKRVPLATVEKVLGLYREQYFDLNVRSEIALFPGHFQGCENNPAVWKPAASSAAKVYYE